MLTLASMEYIMSHIHRLKVWSMNKFLKAHLFCFVIFITYTSLSSILVLVLVLRTIPDLTGLLGTVSIYKGIKYEKDQGLVNWWHDRSVVVKLCGYIHHYLIWTQLTQGNKSQGNRLWILIGQSHRNSGFA